MAVPYTFGSATASIPLSQLDSNFATTITLGNTAVQLGNTITSLTGVSNVASATSLSLGSNGNTTAITVDTNQGVGLNGSVSSEWASSGILQINNSATYSTLSLATTRTPTNGNRMGSIVWEMPNNTATYRTRAEIECDMVGTTANKFGAQIRINTALDNTTGASTNAVFNPYGIGVGNTAPSSGLGIAFPATQSASSDANTLDDYEEGTWTATDASGASLSFTNTTQRYTKIGRLVTLSITDLTWPSTANTSAVEIGGLPFTCSWLGGGAGIVNYTGYTVQMIILNSATTIRFYNTPTAFNRTTNANMSTNTCYFSITYMAT